LSTRYRACQRPDGSFRVLPHELRDLVVTATPFRVPLWHVRGTDPAGHGRRAPSGALLEPVTWTYLGEVFTFGDDVVLRVPIKGSPTG